MLSKPVEMISMKKQQQHFVKLFKFLKFIQKNVKSTLFIFHVNSTLRCQKEDFPFLLSTFTATNIIVLIHLNLTILIV